MRWIFLLISWEEVRMVFDFGKEGGIVWMIWIVWDCWKFLVLCYRFFDMLV